MRYVMIELSDETVENFERAAETVGEDFLNKLAGKDNLTRMVNMALSTWIIVARGLAEKDEIVLTFIRYLSRHLRNADLPTPAVDYPGDEDDDSRYT